MAQSLPKPCRHRGCPALVRGGGYCDDHRAEHAWKGHQGKTAHQRGYGAVWQKLRRLVLRRDHGLCQECGEPGNHVDHIIPKAKGGTNRMDNLQVLCDDCHGRKTAKEAQEAKARKGT